MATVLDFKTAVARQLGKGNALVDVPKRDGAILEAILQYTDDHRWSWNEASASKSNLGTVPTDFNASFDPLGYYYPSPTDRQDVKYVPYADYPMYSDPVFSMNGGIVYTNLAVPFTMLYQKKAYAVATDGSDNSTVLAIPNITTPVKLAIALYWLAAERDRDEFEDFMKIYNRERLPHDVSLDNRKARYARPATRRRDMGWNRISNF